MLTDLAAQVGLQLTRLLPQPPGALRLQACAATPGFQQIESAAVLSWIAAAHLLVPTKPGALSAQCVSGVSVPLSCLFRELSCLTAQSLVTPS